MYDPNSLMYVTKEYENTLKEKAKKIYADDVVKTTLDSVNQELDDILLQINNRLDTINNKSNEIDAYRADVHRFIDQTSINVKDLADSNTGSTTTYPAVTANKENRLSSKVYNYRNFANQKIDLTSFDDISINSKKMNDTDKLKSFDIKISDDEVLKVVEFAITYKQNPTVIRKITDSKITSEEKAVVVNRVFTGRFYIIRPDVKNHPEQIIVKSVVENSDNTADNKEVQVLNVRAMKDSKETQYFDNIGPEIDLYFTITSEDIITISIGNIIPYKWLIRKSSYMVGEDDLPADVSLIIGNISKTFKNINFSSVLNGYLLGTDSELYLTTDTNFKEENLTKVENISYDSTNFWIRDFKGLVFVHSKDKTYVSGKEIANAIDLNVDLSDIKQVSTGEIIGILPNKGLIVFNTESNQFDSEVFITIDGVKKTDTAVHAKTNTFTDEDGEATSTTVVKEGIDFIEIDNNKLLVSSTKNGNLQYFFVPLNNNTNTYYNFTTASNVVSKTIDSYVLANATATKVQLINTVVGQFVLVKVIGATENLSALFNLRDLSITNKNYTYSTFNQIVLFDPVEQQEITDTSVVFDRIYDTSLGSFAITDDNKLYCFDDTYAIKANTTREITQTITTGSEEEENLTTETKSLGFDDDKSFIKLDSSERYDGLYYSVNNPYLNKVLGVFETATGIYICDELGVYELTSDLTLKTKYYTSKDKFVGYSRDISVNKNTIFIANNESVTDIYSMNDIIKEDSSTKLRYNYVDLFTGNYTKYSDSITSYDYDTELGAEKPLIKFNAKLYVSLIDVTGALYNTFSSENIIKYSDTKYAFGDIDPETTHSVNFNVDVTSEDGSVNKQVVEKTVETKMFILHTNKYGFINYEGFDAANLTSDNISDTNTNKVIKINRRSTDTDISFDDIRNQILKMMYNENKKISTAVGKTEYSYERTNLPNGTIKVRSMPGINLGEKITYIDNFDGRTGLVIGGKLKFLPFKDHGNGLNNASNLTSSNLVASNITSTDVKAFTTTSVGTFVWGEDKICWYDDLTSSGALTNQLTGYSSSTDGKILRVFDLKDARQTILVMCEKAIYAYTCRQTIGSTFSKPFSSSTNITKLDSSKYVNIGENNYLNWVSDDKYHFISSTTSPFLLKLNYNDNNKIELEEVLSADKVTNINAKYTSFSNCRVIGDDDLILETENFGVLRYNLKDKTLTTIRNSDANTSDRVYCISNLVEDDNYLYMNDNKTGLYRLNKSTFELENIDPYFYGKMLRINGRVYAFNINSDDVKEAMFLSWYDIPNNRFNEISYIPLDNTGAVIKNEHDYFVYYIREYYKTIYGDDNGIFWVSNTNNTYLNEIIDTEYAYKGIYIKNDGVDGINKSSKSTILNNVNSENYYYQKYDSCLYRNDESISAPDGLAYDIPTYDKTTDSSPTSGKTYYSINGNFSKAFNIKKFDSNVRYYIAGNNYIYTKVDKEQVPNPKVGIEYFVINLSGQYESAGFNFTEFTQNRDYYTRTQNYKLIDTSVTTEPASDETYYVCFDPQYTKIEDIGTSFDSNIDYYENKNASTRYKSPTNILGIKNYFICRISDGTKYLTLAYNINDGSKIVIPFKVEDIYETNLGVFIKYWKDDSTMNFGLLSDDLTTILYDVCDENITDGKGDLIEVNRDVSKTYLDEQEIYVCGKFGVNGKVFKYTPKTSNTTANKFNEVANNSIGYYKLFNIDDDVYVIESTTTLTINKYSKETNSFSNVYTGRRFELVNIAYKIDETGKKDVYIIGNGDYNIYKSYNGSFKPVFTWYNDSIGKPYNVISDNQNIYIEESTNKVRVIGNESDEEFVLTQYNDKCVSNVIKHDSRNFTKIDGSTYIPIGETNDIYTLNLDDKYIGYPVDYSNYYYINYEDTDNSHYSDIMVAHQLDRKINKVPIWSYDNSQLIYTCFDTDINTLMPKGELQHLYESDGTTIKHYVPRFDFYVDSEYGTFGIQGNEVYLRKRYSEENARWTLINNLKTTGSEFKTIIKSIKAGGWLLVDDRTVTKFNSVTQSFDIEIPVSEWTYDGTSKTVKINFIKEFTDSDELLIGYRIDANIANTGVAKPFALQSYRLTDGKYKFVNITGTGSSSSTPISCVAETRFGIMVSYVSYPTGTANVKVTNSNYSSFTTKVGLLKSNSLALTNINFMSTAQSGYTWTSVNGNSLAPTELHQVIELQNSHMIIAVSPLFGRSSTTYTNATIYQWMLVNKDQTNSSADESLFDENNYMFVPVSKNTPTSYTTEYANLMAEETLTHNTTSVNDCKTFVNLGSNSNFIIKTRDCDDYFNDETGISALWLAYDNSFDLDVAGNEDQPGICNRFKLDEISSEVNLDNYNGSSYSSAQCFSLLKKSGDDWYVIIASPNTKMTNSVYDYYRATVYKLAKLNSDTPEFEIVTNSYIPTRYNDIKSADKDKFGIGYKHTKNWDLINYNGVLFVKCFDKVFIIDSKKLTSVTSKEEQFDNSVLYDLRLSINNKNSFNNLTEKTSNSDIDKFIIKESGVIDLSSYELNDNEIKLVGPNNNNVDQFFMPHDYYNKNSKLSTVDSIHVYKEKYDNDYLGGAVKHLYSASKDMNLINNRYLNNESRLINDATGRHTNTLLGDIESYIKDINSCSYDISLNLYPTNVVDQSLDSTKYVGGGGLIINNTIYYTQAERNFLKLLDLFLEDFATNPASGNTQHVLGNISGSYAKNDYTGIYNANSTSVDNDDAYIDEFKSLILTYWYYTSDQSSILRINNNSMPTKKFLSRVQYLMTYVCCIANIFTDWCGYANEGNPSERYNSFYVNVEYQNNSWTRKYWNDTTTIHYIKDALGTTQGPVKDFNRARWNGEPYFSMKGSGEGYFEWNEEFRIY